MKNKKLYESKNSLANGLNNCHGFLFKEKLYVFGGIKDENDSWSPSNKVYELEIHFKE